MAIMHRLIKCEPPVLHEDHAIHERAVPLGIAGAVDLRHDVLFTIVVSFDVRV